VISAAAMLLLLNPARAEAEYSLQAGDVVEISVAGLPELRQRIPVQLDGTITSPNFGTLAVEGAALSEIRSQIQSAVASKVLRIRTPEGREWTRMIERDDVAAVIVEYKPVFVGGDVARPGEQPFRPRMTVRQAIVSAGGGTPGPRANYFDLPGLRSEYVMDWLVVAREEARIWRIKTELGDTVEFSRELIPAAPGSETMLLRILELEGEYRTTRRTDHEQAKSYLIRTIRQADEQIDVLTEQERKEEEGVQADTQELQRYKNLYGQGVLPSPRVADARRALLLSSTRRLQTTTQLIAVKRARAEHDRELEKIDDELRIRLLAELQEATVKAAGAHAKLQSVEEKLQLAGVKVAGMVDAAGKAEVTVFRRIRTGMERLTLDGNAELQPGDVVEIGLTSDHVEIAKH